MNISGGDLGSVLRRRAHELRLRPRADDGEEKRASGAADSARAAAGVDAEDGRLVDQEKRAKETRAAAEGFAGFFLGTMLKEMRKTVQLSPVGHGSDSAEKMFQELADEAYADEAARSAGNAITGLVYQSLMNGAKLPTNS